MTSQNTKRKPNHLLIGSRIRERDKKNAEYYVGDYLNGGQNKKPGAGIIMLQKLCSSQITSDNL